jgi:hypothetical protein
VAGIDPGGAAMGAGLLVLAQQSGAVQVDATNVGMWVVSPGRHRWRGAGRGTGGGPWPGAADCANAPARGLPCRTWLRGGIGMGAGAIDSRGDPPRESYARMDCPPAVPVGQPFELLVGLSPSPDAAVVGGPMRRPDSSVGPVRAHHPGRGRWLRPRGSRGRAGASTCP